ncbi:MAG: DUF445 family protein [Kiritimatiellia bacterium]|jgi:uncharacterized membrane protein YheB (UPF0754 family)
MSLLSEYALKARMVGNRRIPREQRLFAALELVCQPLSFLTILGVAGIPLLARCGVAPPRWFSDRCFPVLVSAAVGYLTNWIAIEMLFKPYEKTWRHLFPLMTFGYWKQGLVPKNKDRIAVLMGEQVATRLLQPEKLADDLCSMAGGMLENPGIVASIQTALQNQVAVHDKEIAAFLAPRIESALMAEIDRIMTAENMQAFWDEQIGPYLESEATREKIAEVLVGALRNHSTDIAARIKPWLVETIQSWCRDKTGMAGVVLEPLAGLLADFLISEQTIEKGLADWLKRRETTTLLRDELSQATQALRDYIRSPEAKGAVGDFIDGVRSRFKDALCTYLENNLADTAGLVLKSEDLWKWAAELLPKMRPDMESFIRRHGTPLIIEKLDVQGRIRSAVDQMDMQEFHSLINEVAAEHLGAIQVLGYVLGAVVGALMLL